MTQKKMKNLLAGFLVILIFAGGYFGVDRYLQIQEEKQAEETRNQEQSRVVLSIDPDQIGTISFEGTDGELLFENQDGDWVCPSDKNFRMDPSKIERMLSDLTALSVTRTLEQADDPEEYGLGKNAKTIHIAEKDGQETVLYVGTRNKSNHDLYFSLDTDTVYMTDAALDSHFTGSLKDFAWYEEFPEMDPSLMRVFDVQKENPYVLDMPGDDNCTVTDAKGNTQRANLNLVGTMQNNLSNISWAENVEYYCSDFSQYGLEDPVAVITVACEKKEARSDDMEKFVFYVGNQDENDNYYVRLGDSMQVHTVRQEYLEDFVESKPESFWSLSYSFVSIGDLECLEVTCAGKTYRMDRKDDSSSLEDTIWQVNGQSADTKQFTDFYYACVSVTAQERLNEIPDADGEPALKLCYHLTDGSVKEIEYYEYDQNFYLVLYENRTKAAYTNKLYVNTMLKNLEKLVGISE
ncbi:MAG: DUF4340 domain-containing protein [Blautia sp.]|nr:DUF4340 domain-containing protein [Blautia sp.]MDY5031482.1 DUF4340 domain-containing protein [Blautia sp.]